MHGLHGAAKAGFAVLLMVASGGAARAANTIVAGDYVVTTQIQDIQNDTTGICTQLLGVGAVQVGVGQILGLGKTAQVVTPVASSTSPYTLTQQICNYPNAPTALDPSGTTPTGGVTTCTLNGTTYTLNTATSDGSIVNVPNTNNDAYYLNATSTVKVGTTTLCTIKTSSLYIYSGLKH